MTEPPMTDWHLQSIRDRDRLASPPRTKAELDRRALLAEVDRLKTLTAAARRWVVNTVDPAAVGKDTKQHMIDRLT